MVAEAANLNRRQDGFVTTAPRQGSQRGIGQVSGAVIRPMVTAAALPAALPGYSAVWQLNGHRRPQQGFPDGMSLRIRGVGLTYRLVSGPSSQVPPTVWDTAWQPPASPLVRAT